MLIISHILAEDNIFGDKNYAIKNVKLKLIDIWFAKISSLQPRFGVIFAYYV